MKTGSRFLNSFVSIFAISCLLFIASASYIHLRIIKNIYSSKTDLLKLDQQIFIEVLVMQRLKYAVETMDYNEEPLSYNDVNIEITYDFEDVEVTYIYPDRSISKNYHYNLDTKTLEIID